MLPLSLPQPQVVGRSMKDFTRRGDMYVSLVWLAVSGWSVGAADELRWQSDYAAVLKQAASERKPVAVFFASGASGWEKLGRDGGLQREAKRVLAERYVCLYVNLATAPGRRLTEAFKMPGGFGIVLSDRSGKVQAFRHEGDLGNRDLLAYLEQYADPNRTARSTQTNPTTYSSFYGPGATAAAGPSVAGPASVSSSGATCYS
jgi:hypothetical protein